MSDPDVYRRSTCRLCESPEVELVLELKACPPVDAYITESQLNEPQREFPLDLFLCRNCGHAQLLDVVSPKLLFGSYIYTTSSSPGLVEYFRKYADDVFTRLQLAPGALALDIGSNDGTLLKLFKAKGMKVLGVDPAESIARQATAAGVETLPRFFSSQVGREVRKDYGPMSLVTANNVFAHSDTLGDMADGVCEVLAPDGVFVFEVSYLLDMIENMVFDFIYHEHLSHHSIRPLKTFLAKHGMMLFDVERTPSKGGTIRCYAQRADGPRKERPIVAELLELEESFGLYRLSTYRDYDARITRAKDGVIALIEPILGSGKKLYGYGASATSTVMIYHFGLGASLSAIVDDNPLRQKRFSPGLHIPVVSSEEIYSERPGAVLVLAWRFAEMIIRQHKRYTDEGGKFVVPLPEPGIFPGKS